MAEKITIEVDGQVLTATLVNSPPASSLLAELPLTFSMSRWGDEYYGGIGRELAGTESAATREIMQVGELAYWPAGQALCIFFGPTPASEGDEPRAASPVVPLGRLETGVDLLPALGHEVRATWSRAG